jgi:ribosomal protein S14
VRGRDIAVDKDIVKRKKFLKSEFKKIILKSILQNFSSNQILRVEVLKQLIFFKKKTSISTQNNVCLLTGRIGGVYTKYNLSRHSIKRVAKLNLLNNTKAASF